jgi:hypothetical protein
LLGQFGQFGFVGLGENINNWIVAHYTSGWLPL